MDSFGFANCFAFLTQRAVMTSFQICQSAHRKVFPFPLTHVCEYAHAQMVCECVCECEHAQMVCVCVSMNMPKWCVSVCVCESLNMPKRCVCVCVCVYMPMCGLCVCV